MGSYWNVGGESSTSGTTEFVPLSRHPLKHFPTSRKFTTWQGRDVIPSRKRASAKHAAGSSEALHKIRSSATLSKSQHRIHTKKITRVICNSCRRIEAAQCHSACELKLLLWINSVLLHSLKLVTALHYFMCLHAQTGNRHCMRFYNPILCGWCLASLSYYFRRLALPIVMLMPHQLHLLWATIHFTFMSTAVC